MQYSLIQFSFIKLPKRCILNLAVIPRHEVLKVSLRSHSNFESSCDLSFTAIPMQINFVHKISFKVASHSACYLTYHMVIAHDEVNVHCSPAKWVFFHYSQLRKVASSTSYFGGNKKMLDQIINL